MGIFSKRTTRREFAQTTVKAAAALTVGGGLISAAEPAVKSATALQQPTAQPSPAGVDALAQLVKERYGKYLTDAQLAEIKQGIDRNMRTSERYARMKLANGDEPDFRFHA